MPKFKIDLMANAFMSQNDIEIEADTYEEAERIAIKTSGDREWKYCEIDDESINTFPSREREFPAPYKGYIR
jgi:3-methyladenine DNA glycosylase Mpg